MIFTISTASGIITGSFYELFRRHRHRYAATRYIHGGDARINFSPITAHHDASPKVGKSRLSECRSRRGHRRRCRGPEPAAMNCQPGRHAAFARRRPGIEAICLIRECAPHGAARHRIGARARVSELLVDQSGKMLDAKSSTDEWTRLQYRNQ